MICCVQVSAALGVASPATIVSGCLGFTLTSHWEFQVSSRYARYSYVAGPIDGSLVAWQPLIVVCYPATVVVVPF